MNNEVDKAVVEDFLKHNGIDDKTINLINRLLRGGMKKNDFVDELHYEMYKRYVKKNRNRITFIVITRNGEYVYINVKIVYDYGYIIGRDGVSNKLFVNIIRPIYISSDLMTCTYDITPYICVVDQQYIKSDILQYDIDMDKNEYSSILLPQDKNVLFYRVQGEIVLRVERATDLRKMYEYMILYYANDQLIELYWLYIANLIIQKLREYHIAAEFTADRSIVIRDAVYRYSSRHTKLKKAIAVANVIVNTLKDLGLDTYTVCSDEYYDIVCEIHNSITNNRFITVYIEDHGRWGSSYMDIIISMYNITLGELLHVPATKQMHDNIIKTIDDYARNVNYVDHTVNANGHIITLKTLPVRIAINVDSVDQVFNTAAAITVNIPMFFVPSNTTIEIVHSQHGKKTIKVLEDYVISITSTNIDTIQNVVMTRLAIELLAKKIPDTP